MAVSVRRPEPRAGPRPTERSSAAMPVSVWGALVVCFGVVAARSLRFRYVDGDDASSIAHHAFDGKSAAHESYAAYQSGADLVLGRLGNDESVLLALAMCISAVATVVTVGLMLRLVYLWAGEAAPELHAVLQGPRRELVGAVVAVAALLAVPEFLYMSLIYLPALMAMALILGAHSTLRWVMEDHRPVPVAVAALMMGVGVAIRWDLGIYGLLVVVDLLWVTPGSPTVRRRRLPNVLGWALSAFLVWLVAIASVGRGLDDLIAGAGVANAATRSVLVVLVWMTTVFTPAIVLALAVGFPVVARSRRRFVLAQIGCIAFAMVVLRWGAPKVMLPFLPAIVFVALAGLARVWTSPSRQRLVRGGMVVVLLLPWVVGVAAVRGDAAWGPGFEIRAIDRAGSGGTSVALTIGEGAAFPTSEGPRPMWGHGSVLLGSGFRDLVAAREVSRLAGLSHAIDTGRPFVVVEGTLGLVGAELAGLDFKPGPLEALVPGIDMLTYSNGSVTITVAKFDQAGRFGEDQELTAALGVLTLDGSIVMRADPSRMRDMYKRAPGSVEPLGIDVAVVRLSGL